MTLAWQGLMLALLAAVPEQPPSITTLYDDAVKVGPGRIRTLDIPLPVEPARIVCTYEVLEGGSGVRVVLLKREDAERWLRGEAHEVLAATPFARRGAFSHRPLEPDHYQIVLDNRLEGRSNTEVHLLVRVVHAPEVKGSLRTAERRKGQILVTLSMLVFACAAGLFAVRLNRNLRARGL